MKKSTLLAQAFFITVMLYLTGCNDNQSEKKVRTETKKDSARIPDVVADTKRGPVINITDTLSLKRTVLVMKDSATNFQRISLKLGEIYGMKLGAILKKNNLKMTGAPMAWYKSQQAPYFFEAGVPVDKKPAKLPAGIFVKEIGLDSVVIAHFYGPYDLVHQGYDALKDWLKDHKKLSKGMPYEIYVGDPLDAAGKPKDPYKVQTDIVWPWK